VDNRTGEREEKIIEEDKIAIENTILKNTMP